jgi:hypothetical protein
MPCHRDDARVLNSKRIVADTATALQRAANRTAAEADRISAAFARQLAKVLRDTDRALRSWIAQQPDRPSPSARGQIRGLLQQSGFDALAQAATAGPFDAMATRVVTARRAAALDVDASPLTVLRIEAWRQWHQDDLLTEGSILTRALGDVVMRGTGRARRRLPDDLTEILDRAEGRVQTLYDTAVSVFGRQVEAEQAGDDARTPFAYMGPVDAKTRDFCLGHVGRVYTRAEIDQLDNGQISNVFLTGGGYNCRHVWQEISKFSELYEQKAAPEIIDAVEDVRKAA